VELENLFVTSHRYHKLEETNDFNLGKNLIKKSSGRNYQLLDEFAYLFNI